MGQTPFHCCRILGETSRGAKKYSRGIESLSPLAPQLRHRDVRKSQVEGVGDWLVRTEEFINQRTGEGGVVKLVLFCYGDPGVGKTHIRYVPTLFWENWRD